MDGAQRDNNEACEEPVLALAAILIIAGVLVSILAGRVGLWITLAGAYFLFLFLPGAESIRMAGMIATGATALAAVGAEAYLRSKAFAGAVARRVMDPGVVGGGLAALTFTSLVTGALLGYLLWQIVIGFEPARRMMKGIYGLGLVLAGYAVRVVASIVIASFSLVTAIAAGA